MSDTPKFEVIDRRKIKAEEEKESGPVTAPPAQPEKPSVPAHAQGGPAPGPRLVVNEPRRAAEDEEPQKPARQESADELPPAPTN
jgi:hypothetical protein